MLLAEWQEFVVETRHAASKNVTILTQSGGLPRTKRRPRAESAVNDKLLTFPSRRSLLMPRDVVDDGLPNFPDCQITQLQNP